MNTAPRPESSDRSESKTEAEKQHRLAKEAEMIADARADLDAGLFVESAEVDAWIDSIGTGQELPLPPTRRR